MVINNPLIKADETSRIMNKTTANIFELLKRDEKREERPNMKNTKDLIQAYTDATVYSGVESKLGERMGVEKAKAFAAAIDANASALYVASQNLFARTSAIARKTNTGPTPPKADNSNTPSSTPGMRGPK